MSLPTLVLVMLFILGLVAFLFREAKATSPMMPLGLWRNRLIAVANVATLTSGAIMIGLSSFLPTYVQGVMGYSAIVAGLDRKSTCLNSSHVAISYAVFCLV